MAAAARRGRHLDTRVEPRQHGSPSRVDLALELVGRPKVDGAEALTDLGDAADKTFSVVFRLGEGEFEAAWDQLLLCDPRVAGRKEKYYALFDEAGARRSALATAPLARNTTTDKIYNGILANLSKWGHLPPSLESPVEELERVTGLVEARFLSSLTTPLAYECATCDKKVLYCLSGDARLVQDSSLHFECTNSRHTEPPTPSPLDEAEDEHWTDAADVALIEAVEEMNKDDEQNKKHRHISSALKYAEKKQDFKDVLAALELTENKEKKKALKKRYSVLQLRLEYYARIGRIDESRAKPGGLRRAAS